MDLARYKLRDANERAALRGLKPLKGDDKHCQDFQRRVLACLALIGEKYRKSDTAKSEQSAQKLRRHATKIRNFVRWLKSSKPNGLMSFPPSSSELLRYAEGLSSVADFRVTQARTKRLRHSTHKETSLILHLLHFVREQTGKHHWKEMATLLRGACDDHGMNERRLRALWNRSLKRGHWLRAALRPLTPFPSVAP